MSLMENLDVLILADLGRRMRLAQKAYFKARTKDAFLERKRLEREFDKTVESIFNNSKKGEQ